MKIVLDCDDVLLATNRALSDFYVATYGTNKGIDAGVYCSQWSVWGKGREERLENWRKFLNKFISSDYYTKISPMPDSVDMVDKLKTAGYSLSVLTSTGNTAAIRKKRHLHLKRIYGENAFKDVVCLPLGWGNKSEALKSLEGDVLIDDSIHNVADALKTGANAVLFKTPANSSSIDSIFSNRLPEVSDFMGSFGEECLTLVKEKAAVADGWISVGVALEKLDRSR